MILKAMSKRKSLVAAIGRLYPFYSGNFQLVNSRIGRALTKTNEALAWCRSPGGELLVPLSDEVGRCIYFTGDYDRKLTWLCKKLVRPGDIALDVGANLGLVTLALARFTGPSGQVHAFEPNPVLQGLVQSSLERNSIDNVVLHKIALGASNDELNLFVPLNNFGQGSFKYHSNLPGSSNYKCIVKRLSDVVQEYRLNSIQLIKIDVEGFENEVLLGGEDVLRELRPSAIILETNEQNQPAFRDRAAVRTLRRLGYRFLAIPKALVRMTVLPIDIENSDDPGHDVIAVPEEKFPKLTQIGLL
jgi:FkbM family methyltransferase